MPRLMVVDDEIDIVEVTKKYFTKRGIETVSASEGNEAIRIIQEQKPDLILLDYNLPGLSGKEILKKMREELKLNTKVIIVTGFETDTVKNETKDFGIQACVHKPLNLEELEKIVMRELGGNVK